MGDRVAALGVRAFVATVVACSSASCSGVPKSTPSPYPGRLTVDSPTSGSTVCDRDGVIIVGGTAPAHSRVVQDRASTLDQSTVARADGTWRLEVDLFGAENDLTFRIDDHQETAVTVKVGWDIPPCPLPTPRPTVRRPSATPNDIESPSTGRPLVALSGEPMVTQGLGVVLDVGRYVLTWAVGANPYRWPGCGMRVVLTGPTQNTTPLDVSATSKDAIAPGTSGEAEFEAATDGRYQVTGWATCEWRVTLASSTGSPSPSVAQTPKPTSRGEAGDPLPLRLAGEASDDYRPLTKSIHLGGGDYRLRWTAREPFPEPGICGVTITLFNPIGDYAGGESGVSTTISSGRSGQVDYASLKAGTYELFVYVGCPWEVEFDRP